MTKFVFVVFRVALCLIAGSAAHAQMTVDVSKITCWQFAAYKVADPKLISVWLNGYYHGRRGSTIVDRQVFEEDEKKMREYCIKNGEVPLMQAAEAVFGPDR